MMRTFIRIFAVSLLVMAAVPSFGQSGNDGKSGVVLGSEIMPKDTTKARRFTNHLIAPKGGWQCGLTVMYADFNSENLDYMLVLQGLSAKASMFRIAPEAAYTFKDNHAIGLRFQYTKAGGVLDGLTADLLGNMELPVGNIGGTSLSMGANVFQRTYVGIDKRGRFGIFWDYILGYTRSKTQFSASEGTYSLKEKGHLAFAPGVVYFPMNNLSIQACVSLAELSYNQVEAYESGVVTGTRAAWKAQANLNVLNLNFGLTIHL
jgi:hypothetical protein